MQTLGLQEAIRRPTPNLQRLASPHGDQQARNAQGAPSRSGQGGLLLEEGSPALSLKDEREGISWGSGTGNGCAQDNWPLPGYLPSKAGESGVDHAVLT